MLDLRLHQLHAGVGQPGGARGVGVGGGGAAFGGHVAEKTDGQGQQQDEQTEHDDEGGALVGAVGGAARDVHGW